MRSIELAGVRKAFNRGQPAEVRALDGIDLAIPPNQLTVFSGPSGSGKTTLLSVIGGMTRPTEGRVRLDGEDVSAYPERFLTALRRVTFGFVFQDLHLVRGLSALENVMVPAYPLGGDWPALRERAFELLEALRVGHRASERVERLSGGEQQRVAIARALVNRPKVLLADEPTANLDSALTKEFLAILESLAAEGKSILLSSHDPAITGSAVVQRRIELRDGRIVADR
ncbi:MAG: ABC transporter ATP-binding protein [Vicinamibacteria bacterium]